MTRVRISGFDRQKIDFPAFLFSTYIFSSTVFCVGGAKFHGQFWNQWVWLRWFDTENKPLRSFKGQKLIIFGFDWKCVGGEKIWERFRLLRIWFSLKRYLDRTFITRCDRYRCFSDYFRFTGHFRFHDTILTRPMTQFNSLPNSFKRNYADTSNPLGPNFCIKLCLLKKNSSMRFTARYKST